jgi:tetratricopeptide (TPR) repeat protein
MTQRRIGWLVLALAVAAQVILRWASDARSVRTAATPPELYIRSGKVLKALSLGYDGLLADIYWTRVVQYFGRQSLARAKRFDLLGPLLFLTTDLDPHLIVAYRFGAIFLAEKPPAGAGEPQLALQLLRRGIVENPDYWRLWQDLGFIYYWDLKDYPSAARAFKAGSERPGAAIWMKTLAASVAVKGGEIRTSQLLWSEIYRHAQNDAIRRSALAHLAALKARQDMNSIDGLVATYVAHEHQPPASLRDLVAAGLLRGMPRDPSGAPYVLGPGHRVHLSPESKVNLKLLQ